MALYQENRKKGFFVMVEKEHVHNTNLSWKAKGLLSYFKSRPGNWQFFEKEMILKSVDGRASTRAALKELLDKGIVRKVICRNHDGTYGACRYELCSDMKLIEGGGEKTYGNSRQSHRGDHKQDQKYVQNFQEDDLV